MSTVDGLTAPADVGVSTSGRRRWRRPGAGPSIGTRRAAWAGWLFALPALVMYAVFELYPIVTSIQYSFYDWDGIGVASPAELKNYARVFSEPQLVASIVHSFILIAFFSILSVFLALIVASILREIRSQFGGGVARTLMFLPQIITGAASAIAWTWMYSPDGAVNQTLSALGLGALRKTWLGDFTWALPAVGIIGTWLATGLCTLLPLAGIGKIDASIYEAASIDGANRIQQFFAITLPACARRSGSASRSRSSRRSPVSTSCSCPRRRVRDTPRRCPRRCRGYRCTNWPSPRTEWVVLRAGHRAGSAHADHHSAHPALLSGAVTVMLVRLRDTAPKTLPLTAAALFSVFPLLAGAVKG